MDVRMRVTCIPGKRWGWKWTGLLMHNCIRRSKKDAITRLRTSWCQHNPIWRITNQTHAMLQKEHALLPELFASGVVLDAARHALTNSTRFSWNTFGAVLFHIFLKVRRFPVAEKMAGSRPRCPTGRKFLLTVLDTGVMIHENAEAANGYQPLELVYTVPKLAVQYQCTCMHFRSNSFHDSLHGWSKSILGWWHLQHFRDDLNQLASGLGESFQMRWILKPQPTWERDRKA